MFTPTKEVLLELGFTVTEIHEGSSTVMRGNKKIPHTDVVIHVSDDGSIWLGKSYVVYPQSLEDIKTLIRLLTPHD